MNLFRRVRARSNGSESSTFTVEWSRPVHRMRLTCRPSETLAVTSLPELVSSRVCTPLIIPVTIQQEHAATISCELAAATCDCGLYASRRGGPPGGSGGSGAVRRRLGAAGRLEFVVGPKVVQKRCTTPATLQPRDGGKKRLAFEFCAALTPQLNLPPRRAKFISLRIRYSLDTLMSTHYSYYPI